ncbi:MAG: peptide chain release factor N(5)-glutamine methyltransferase [bacterium]
MAKRKTDMATFHEVLKTAEKRARAHRVEAAAVKLLFSHFAKLTPTELYTSLAAEMTEADRLAFEQAVTDHLENNVPVQYIIGYVYFYGHRFLVDDRVLIPRFETEELVANILMYYDELFAGQPATLVDVGTGSGCLAVTLALEEANLQVTATDISPEALTVATDNARNLGARVEFLSGDMLAPLVGRTFDILVSNPPYIPVGESLEKVITGHEPDIALYGGDDGLKFYRIILAGAAMILKTRSIIAFEHGFDKAEELRAIATANFPKADVFTIRDMQGRDRMTFILNR